MGRVKGQKCPPWTQDEIQILIYNYGKLSKQELLTLLPRRSAGTIKVKAHHLGLTKPTEGCKRRYSSCDRKLIEEEIIALRQQGNGWEEINKLYGQDMRNITRHDPRSKSYTKAHWTEEDLSYIRENYKTESDKEMGNHLGKTRDAIRYKRQKLGLRCKSNRLNPKAFLESEIMFIQENYQILTDSEIAESLHRPTGSMFYQRRRLGLTKTVTKWSEEEIQFLRDNYLTMTDIEIGEHINRGRRGVQTKRVLLRLLRSSTSEQ